MENLGDFLPLIIIVITFIYSFVSGLNKKKEEEKKRPVSPAAPSMSSPAAPKRRKTVVPDSLPPAEKKYESLEDLSDYDIERRLVTYTSNLSPSPYMQEKQQAQERSDRQNALLVNEPVFTGKGEEGQFVLTEPEEIKKAVIYSEIFNRKYF